MVVFGGMMAKGTTYFLIIISLQKIKNKKYKMCTYTLPPMTEQAILLWILNHASTIYTVLYLDSKGGCW